MSSCPHCGESLPDEVSYCKHCGGAVSLDCTDCGESVPAQANFCPNCRRQLSPTPGAVSDDDGPFRLDPREFARRLEGSELGSEGIVGWLNRRKEVRIETGHRALFLEDGELVDTLGAGRHTLETLSQRIRTLERSKNLSVVLVDDRDTVVDIEIDDVRTKSEYTVAVYVELVFDVESFEPFVESLLADRNAVTAETFGRLLGDKIRDELQAIVSQHERDDLYGNRELKRDLRQDIERQCRTTLERYGMRLLELRSFEYDDDRDEIREGRKQVEIRKEKEDIEDETSRLDRRDEERTTEDTVHAERQRVRRETAEQSADHEIETQEIEQSHEKDDIQRRHRHGAEREDVEHEQEKATTRKEGEVDRRSLEHEQDVEEMEDLMDVKKRKEMDDLDVDEREQDLETQREEHDVKMERERLEARDDVDLDTLASLEDADASAAELAEMAKAGELSPEQLDALGAQDNDELAKARQEAKTAEKERQRVEDQEEFREEIKEMAEKSMDRMQESSESAMDNVSETGRAAAEDTSDNVIVSGSEGSDDGDTTIVQGGTTGDDGDDNPERIVVVCPACEAEVAADAEFCPNCGAEV